MTPDFYFEPEMATEEEQVGMQTLLVRTASILGRIAVETACLVEPRSPTLACDVCLLNEVTQGCLLTLSLCPA